MSAKAPIIQNGQTNKYQAWFDEQARKLALLGLRDEDIAGFFGVAPGTIQAWKKNKPTFNQALVQGRIGADAEVAATLYKKATGFEYTEQQAVKIKTSQFQEEVKIVEITKYCPPDTGAIAFYLKNRQKQLWRDRHDVNPEGDDPLEGIEVIFIRPGRLAKLTDDKVLDLPSLELVTAEPRGNADD